MRKSVALQLLGLAVLVLLFSSQIVLGQDEYPEPDEPGTDPGSTPVTTPGDVLGTGQGEPPAGTENTSGGEQQPFEIPVAVIVLIVVVVIGAVIVLLFKRRSTAAIPQYPEAEPPPESPKGPVFASLAV